MSDNIGLGDDGGTRPASLRQLVPMQVGNATVYVEKVGEPVEIEADDRIYPVAPPGPGEAFEKAGEILHECVRVVGERIEGLAYTASPNQVTVEFTLSFEAKGKAQLIPVLFTGETKAQTGLKVTAVWDSQVGGA